MIVVTLDGPAGSGKSSVGKKLAARKGFYFLSTGLIYRALGWHLANHNWRGEEPVEDKLLEDFQIRVDVQNKLYINGQLVEEALNTDVASHLASLVSTLANVRAKSSAYQRQIAESIEREKLFPGIIIEGRDSGTVVFPNAQYKFFITASDQVRAQRRFDELSPGDPGLTLHSVLEAIQQRDKRDMERELAPLKPAPDARIIDTSDMTFEQVIEALDKAIQL